MALLGITIRNNNIKTNVNRKTNLNNSSTLETELYELLNT